MRLPDFTRGVGFRNTALSTLLVFMAMAALGVAVFTFVNASLQSRVHARIEEVTTELLAIEANSGPNALTEEITRRTKSEGPRRYFYRISSKDGATLAGEAFIRPATMEWSRQTAQAPTGGSVATEQLLVLSRASASGNVLSVGREVQWISDVEERLLEVLAWLSLISVLLAAGASWLANRFIARRVETLSRSARAIMSGDLAHRVPLSGAGDDFDRLAQTLNEMLDRIHELMQNLEQVTNDIAHDLRTPLGRMRQGLELARNEGQGEVYAQAVDHAIEEADALLTTFTSLLRIAQIESGARRSAFRTVDFSAVMRSVADAYEFEIEESGRHLVRDIADGVDIVGDKDLLVQALANTVENALIHTPVGARISMSLARLDGAVVARVADDGPGVPAAEREKIFRRFYRVESSRTTPGTGLGLSLVAAVAKLHGAEVEARSNSPGLCICLVFHGG